MNAILKYIPVLAVAMGDMAGTAAPENNSDLAPSAALKDKASGRNHMMPMPIQGTLIA